MDKIEFPWEDFYERFVNNYEEFRFYYRSKILDISFSKDGKIIAISLGNDDEGYLWRDYSSPLEFLSDRIFDNKTLEQVWEDEIKYYL